MEEIVCFAYGRVQNVMFRDFIARGARHLGLTGYVRNLDDGSVEFVAQGQKEKLEQLIERARRGSLFSRVDRVEAQWRVPAQSFDGFELKL